MIQERRHGFSLVELMIALLVMAVVTGQILAMSGAQFRTYMDQERVVDAQEDARLVADQMLVDLRMAGFMVPAVTGVASVDGGNAAADVFCASNAGAIDDTVLEDQTSRFPGASLTAALGAGVGQVTLQAGDMDIDGNTVPDFSVGGGIIVSNGNQSHCARITLISGPGNNVVDFLPVTPGGFGVAPPTARAVPAHVYEINGGSLTRNNLQLSALIEDLQVEYGVDANDDGQLTGAEFPVHDLNASNPSDVLSVRISVLARTAAADVQTPGPGRQAVANRAAAGAGDNFKRRLVSVTATPPNLL